MLDWDYSALADAYVHRPPYAPSAIAEALDAAGLRTGARALDLGAGAGHLTREFSRRGLAVTALEPNPKMRAHGVESTRDDASVRWVDARMEETGLPSGSFELASFGSSFGVADRDATLREAARVLAPGGWILLVFNHRDLDDPLQKEIEESIRARVPSYRYGPRRDDQTTAIDASGRFGTVRRIEARFEHPVDEGWIRAWGSHATLQRQAGSDFDSIVRGIAAIAARHPGGTVPYFTRAWLAPVRPEASA